MSWDHSLLRKFSSTGHFRLLNQLRTELREHPLNRNHQTRSLNVQIKPLRANDQKVIKRVNQADSDKNIDSSQSISNKSIVTENLDVDSSQMNYYNTKDKLDNTFNNTTSNSYNEYSHNNASQGLENGSINSNEDKEPFYLGLSNTIDQENESPKTFRERLDQVEMR